MEKILTVSKGLLPAALLPSLVQGHRLEGWGHSQGVQHEQAQTALNKHSHGGSGGCLMLLTVTGARQVPTPPIRTRMGNIYPTYSLALGRWEAPVCTGGTTRAEALHPRQTENPCPTIKGKPPQDTRDQQMLPHRPPTPAPQAWGGQGGPRVTLHPWVPSSLHQQVVMAASTAGVAAPVSHPPLVTQAAPGGQAGSYFRHCPIWRLPEPNRRDLTAIPTGFCQQLLFKEGQRPHRLLTGHTAPHRAHHSLGKSSSHSSILLLLHLQELQRSRDGSWHAAVSGTWPGRSKNTCWPMPSFKARFDVEELDLQWKVGTRSSLTSLPNKIIL